MFTDSKWLSGAEKQTILDEWVLFVGSNMDESFFTPNIYKHLHLHCGHIAHYDIRGFYSAQFSAPSARARFMAKFFNDHETGRLYWGANEAYKDLGEAMYEALSLASNQIVDAAQKEHVQSLLDARACIDAELSRAGHRI